MTPVTPERRRELLELARGLTRETLHGAPPIASTMDLASGIIEILSDPEDMLTAEDLIDDYINGNLGKVREKLEQAPPMTAAIVAVDLYRMILTTGTLENPSAAVFLERLRAWQ